MIKSCSVGMIWPNLFSTLAKNISYSLFLSAYLTLWTTPSLLSPSFLMILNAWRGTLTNCHEFAQNYKWLINQLINHSSIDWWFHMSKWQLLSHANTRAYWTKWSGKLLKVSFAKIACSLAWFHVKITWNILDVNPPVLISPRFQTVFY